MADIKQAATIYDCESWIATTQSISISNGPTPALPWCARPTAAARRAKAIARIARPAEQSHIWDIFDPQPWAMTVLLETLASWGITSDMLLVFAVGFFAQLVDGALGMAFGIVASTGLMTLGLSPAAASAVVHTAEIATTGASGASHAWFRNVDWRLFRRLAISGMAGGVLGALVLSQVDGKAFQPFVAAYLLVMGCIILMRAVRMTPVEDARPDYAPTLGLIGGFLDAVGGGGWGPMVTSTLVGSGHAPRQVIGTVSASEFCVTSTIAVIFFSQLGLTHVGYIIALVAGGLLAAPFGAIVAGRVNLRPLMFVVGLLVTALPGFSYGGCFPDKIASNHFRECLPFTTVQGSSGDSGLKASPISGTESRRQWL